MTEIKYTRYPKVSLSVEGHCMAKRDNGIDLCCAAVSMLVCTLLQRVEELPLSSKALYCSDGYARVEFDCRGRNSRQGIEALNTILTGFRLLRDKYPDNIKITGGRNE